ncbi:hypothetical protein BZG12_16370 [Salinivibrio kushneri]|nr:hypothetical protein BZG12_16370 [Salinivibrio kushneri]
MASGCIIICNDKDLMKAYGLLPDVHYIYIAKYTNSEDVFSNYSESLLEYIRSNSQSIVQNFSVSAVTKSFIKIINE